MKLMAPTNKLYERQYSQCKHGVFIFISFDFYTFSNGVLNGTDEELKTFKNLKTTFLRQIGGYYFVLHKI